MMPAFVKDVAGWIQSGKLTWRETIDEGIENAPGAFMKLFTGDNMGKMLVKL
jgi:NADPH-dependent curcumin reductase CurA